MKGSFKQLKGVATQRLRTIALGYGKDRQKKVLERVGRVKETPCRCWRRKTCPGTLPVNHEPHGNTQNDRNGLI